MANRLDLSGKNAIVTGASSGMGKAISLLFAESGATVYALARRADRLKELEKSSERFTGKIVAITGDVSDRDGIISIIDKIIVDDKRLDIVVNNAGIMDEMMPAHETTDELWNNVLKVNLEAPFIIIRKCITQFLKQGSGNIINIASIGGLQGSRAGAAYTASKFGVVGLTKNTAYMYAKKGIRCNAIAPGSVNTEISVGIKAPSELGIERAMSGLATSPRNGEAAEIAEIALFLASDASSIVNGAVITADAGWTAY
jgi:NAD(P)-dependent dehydrogenase (short-subunit alcohol dehydrogenase family)